MTPYYADDLVTLYCDEAQHVLPTLRAFDLLLTDPPYGIGEASNSNKSRSKLAVSKDYGSSDWDDAPPPKWLLELARDMTRWQVIFGGNYFNLPPARCWL